MNSQRKKYIPSSRHNPELQARRIDRLSEEVARLNKVLNSVTTSYDRHMEHLSAFAKHDMGNAVQSMYAILKILEKKVAARRFFSFENKYRQYAKRVG